MKHADLLSKYGTSAILESNDFNNEETTIEGVLLEGMEIYNEIMEEIHENKIESITEAASREKMIMESADLTTEELTAKLEAVLEAASSTKWAKVKNFIQKIIIKMQSFAMKAYAKLSGLQKSLVNVFEEIGDALKDAKEDVEWKGGQIEVASRVYLSSNTIISSLIDVARKSYEGKSVSFKGSEKDLGVAIGPAISGKKVFDFTKVKSDLKKKSQDYRKMKEETYKSSNAGTFTDLSKEIDKEDFAAGNRTVKEDLDYIQADLKSAMAEKKSEKNKNLMQNFTQLSSMIQLVQIEAIKAGMFGLKEAKKLSKKI